jgi:hypothetical protein
MCLQKIKPQKNQRTIQNKELHSARTSE